MQGAPIVRRAGLADGPLLGELLHAFNVEFESPTPDAADLAVGFARILASDDVLVFLAELPAPAPAPCGFAFLTARPTPYADGPILQLEELYVRPSLRDRGIGSLIMQAVLDEARQRGAFEVHINVDEPDTDTRRFYERLGFVNVDPGTGDRMLCYLLEL